MATWCRVIHDVSASGAWNMAVDEALLTSAEEGGAPLTLRLYSWSEPTLSLGYFQSIADRPDNLAQLPTVRRLTGGGAIVHDRELTYSLVCPSGSWPKPGTQQLVRDLHAAVLETLDQPTISFSQPSPVEPFLCFARRAETDLVLGPSKIMGSAQRQRRGVLLQHGSILLSASSLAPHLTGLNDAGVAADRDQLARALASKLARRWSVDFRSAPLTDHERSLALKLEVDRYANPAWTARR